MSTSLGEEDEAAQYLGGQPELTDAEEEEAAEVKRLEMERNKQKLKHDLIKLDLVTEELRRIHSEFNEQLQKKSDEFSALLECIKENPENRSLLTETSEYVTIHFKRKNRFTPDKLIELDIPHAVLTFNSVLPKGVQSLDLEAPLLQSNLATYVGLYDSGTVTAFIHLVVSVPKSRAAALLAKLNQIEITSFYAERQPDRSSPRRSRSRSPRRSPRRSRSRSLSQSLTW